MQAGKQPPPSSTSMSRWRRRDWGGGAETNSTRSWAKLSPPDQKTNSTRQHWQMKTQKARCGHSAHHTATRELMGTTWLPRFGPSLSPNQPPDLGLAPGREGGDLKTWKDVEEGNMRDSRNHWCIAATLPLFRAFQCQQNKFFLSAHLLCVLGAGIIQG